MKKICSQNVSFPNIFKIIYFQSPREDVRHGKIQGYHVGFRVYHSPEPFQYKPVEANEENELQSTYVTGLLPFTKYEIIVKAYNMAGAGPPTDSIIGTTLETGKFKYFAELSKFVFHNVDIANI